MKVDYKVPFLTLLLILPLLISCDGYAIGDQCVIVEDKAYTLSDNSKIEIGSEGGEILLQPLLSEKGLRVEDFVNKKCTHGLNDWGIICEIWWNDKFEWQKVSNENSVKGYRLEKVNIEGADYVRVTFSPNRFSKEVRLKCIVTSYTDFDGGFAICSGEIEITLQGKPE